MQEDSFQPKPLPESESPPSTPDLRREVLELARTVAYANHGEGWDIAMIVGFIVDVIKEEFTQLGDHDFALTLH
eukprot:9650441-Prorocentrum_lima.AAC.1